MGRRCAGDRRLVHGLNAPSSIRCCLASATIWRLGRCHRGRQHRPAQMSPLILKRAPIEPGRLQPAGEWCLCSISSLVVIVVVGRIFLSPAAPQDRQWMWMLAYGYHEDRTPTHGYEPNARGGDGDVRKELAQKLGFMLPCADVLVAVA
jgi:hypothetical protein